MTYEPILHEGKIQNFSQVEDFIDFSCRKMLLEPYLARTGKLNPNENEMAYIQAK